MGWVYNTKHAIWIFFVHLLVTSMVCIISLASRKLDKYSIHLRKMKKISLKFVVSWRMFYLSCYFSFKVLVCRSFTSEKLLHICFVSLFILLQSQGFFGPLYFFFCRMKKELFWHGTYGMFSSFPKLISSTENIPAYLVFFESAIQFKVDV